MMAGIYERERLVAKPQDKLCACGCGEIVVRVQKNAIYASTKCNERMYIARQKAKRLAAASIARQKAKRLAAASIATPLGVSNLSQKVSGPKAAK